MTSKKVADKQEAASTATPNDVFATSRQTFEKVKANFTKAEFAEVLQAIEAMEAECKKCCCSEESAQQKSKLNKD